MTRPTAPSPSVGTVRRRPPVPVIVAAVLLGLKASIGSGGLVYFGLFVGPDVNPNAGEPAAIAFVAVGLLLVVTTLASLPGLWRGRRTAWHILTCTVTANLYFNCYKLFVEAEADSVVFLAVGLVEGTLLLLPATRRHVSA